MFQRLWGCPLCVDALRDLVRSLSELVGSHPGVSTHTRGCSNLKVPQQAPSPWKPNPPPHAAHLVKFDFFFTRLTKIMMNVVASALNMHGGGWVGGWGARESSNRV